MSLSTRKLFFISGNENYEVNKGIIEFHEEIVLDWSSSSSSTSIFEKEAMKRQRNEEKLEKEEEKEEEDYLLQCIIAVPSFMIHQVRYSLHFFSPFLSKLSF